MFVYNHFENDSRVLKEALTLASAGHKVHIIAIWKKGLPRLEQIDEIDKTDNIDKTGKIHKLNTIVVHRLEIISVYILLLGRENFDRLKKIIYGFSTPPAVGPGKTPLFRPHEKKRLGFFKFFFSTIKKFLTIYCFYREIDKFFSQKKMKADLFHAHDLNTLHIGYRMAKKFGAKLVYDSHELYVHHNRPYIPPTWFLKLEERFERRYIKKSDAVITVSQSIADYLEKKYNISKPHLIMNAPHQKTGSLKNNHCLRKILKIDDAYKILLYTGGITFGRGLDKAIESLVDLQNLFFVMMGSGTEEFKNYLAAVAKKAGVEDRVAFFGPVSSGEVTAYAASADVGIAPIENVCLSYYFCAPNKVFEYIQSELPVVASNFPDMKRIVEGNDIGLTCDMSNPLEISRAVEQVLMDSPAYLKNICEIKDRYCWEKEALKLKQVYADLYGGQ